MPEESDGARNASQNWGIDANYLDWDGVGENILGRENGVGWGLMWAWRG